MTPEAQAKYLDQVQHPDLAPLNAQLTQMRWPGRTVRDGLINMMEAGVQRVKAGDFDALRFECFNIAEAEFVKAYMDEHHPTVRYTRTWLDWSRGAGSDRGSL